MVNFLNLFNFKSIQVIMAELRDFSYMVNFLVTCVDVSMETKFKYDVLPKFGVFFFTSVLKKARLNRKEAILTLTLIG